MKVLSALLFLALGGVLFFLLRTPEKEVSEPDTVSNQIKNRERGISNTTFYPPVNTDQTRKIPDNKNNRKNGNKKEKEIQLDLKEAVNNELFGGMINGPQASGSLVLFDNQIQSLSITLTPFGKAPINFQLEGVPLEAAGSFIYEGEDEMISGIITPSGDKNYILRFATGPLVGSTLLFEIVSSYEDKVTSEENQISQAYALSDQTEIQDMNEPPESSVSEMNYDNSKMEEMPVNETEVNQEMGAVDYPSETTTADMQDSTDRSGFNF